MPPHELLVVNKVDAASDLMLAKLRHALPGAVFVSARTGDGIDALRRRISELAAPTDTAVDVVIPYDRGDLVARVHADGRVQQAEHNPDGTRIKARVPVALAASLREFAARLDHPAAGPPTNRPVGICWAAEFPFAGGRRFHEQCRQVPAHPFRTRA